MIVPVLGQLVYVSTELNYPCECAICTDPMTRRVETQEFIDNMLCFEDRLYSFIQALPVIYS